MRKKELLNKCEKYDRTKKILIKGLFIIQENKLHDSGYKLMSVIGHTEYDENINDFHYYLLSNCCSDVINLYGNLYNNGKDIKQINIDINKNGIIHIWSDYDGFIPRYMNISNCWLDNIGDEKILKELRGRE